MCGLVQPPLLGDKVRVLRALCRLSLLARELALDLPFWQLVLLEEGKVVPIPHAPARTPTSTVALAIALLWCP